MIRRFPRGRRLSSDQSVTSAVSLSNVRANPENREVVRPRGSHSRSTPGTSTPWSPPSWPPARCRGWLPPGPGVLPPGPMVSERNAPRGLQGHARNSAYTFTRHLPSVLFVLRPQACLMLEGRTLTLSGPFLELSRAWPAHSGETATPGFPRRGESAALPEGRRRSDGRSGGPITPYQGSGAFGPVTRSS